MSIPVKIVVDWSKLEICESCASKIAMELTKIIRDRRPANIDISILLCDECWKHNVDNGAIKAELDPNVVRRRG
jgi:ribosome-binding protein aMBF1 (putative translation factor)